MDTYVKNDCENVTKFMKITSNSTRKRQKRQKAQNDKKTSFLKELVDLHKPVLNKIKSTNELCVKYYFVALLMGFLSEHSLLAKL